jgi:acetoin utilization protein AcuB
VGMITESVLFRVFIELFGARQKGVRVSVTMPNEKGALAKIASAVSHAGGNIIALGTFLGEDPSSGRCTLKVDGVRRDDLVAALTPQVRSVDDVREI